MEQDQEIRPFKIYSASDIMKIIKDVNFYYLPHEQVIDIFFSYIVYDEIKNFDEIEKILNDTTTNIAYIFFFFEMILMEEKAAGKSQMRDALINYYKKMSNVFTENIFVSNNYLNPGQYRFHLYKKKTLLIYLKIQVDINLPTLYKNIFNLDLDLALALNIEMELKKYYLLDYNNNFYEQFTIWNSNNFINILLYYDEFAYNFINIYKAYTAIILYKFTQLETVIRNHFLNIDNFQKFNSIQYSDIITLRKNNFEKLFEKHEEERRDYGENGNKLIEIVDFYREDQYVEFTENATQYFGKILENLHDNSDYNIKKIAEKKVEGNDYTLLNITAPAAPVTSVPKNQIAETKYLECKVDENKKRIEYEDDDILFIIKYNKKIVFKISDIYYIDREKIINDDNFVFLYIASFIEKDDALELKETFKIPLLSDIEKDDKAKEFIRGNNNEDNNNENNIFLFYSCTRKGLQNIYDDEKNKIYSKLYDENEALEALSNSDE